MPSTPLDPRPDHAPLDPTAVPPVEAEAGAPDATTPDATPAGRPGPEVDLEAERAHWRDRRTGLIALVVVTVALWAVIAAAVGFATTM